MENKEITLLDLVKIAARWIWVLVLGAVICAVVAYVYSSQFVAPLYSASSKFVIQTKGQSADSDILDSQRTVAYAQLAVGTYIDVVDTNNFAKEVAFYMNGNVKEQKMTESAINALICQAIIADGGIYDYKKDESGAEILDENGNRIPSTLRTNLLLLANEGLISYPVDDAEGKMVYNVVHARLLNNNKASMETRGITSASDQAAEMDKRLASENFEKLLKDMVADGDFIEAEIYSGDTAEKIAQLNEILYYDIYGNSLVENHYVSKEEDKKNNNLNENYNYNYIYNKETGEYELVSSGKGEYRRNGYKGNKYYSAASIRGMMSFSPAEEESTTFDITIKGGNAEEAHAIARICEVVIEDYIEEVYPGQGVIKTIENSQFKAGQINDNAVLMTLIGFVGGFLLAFVVVYIIELSDNRIKNETELSAKTGLSVVGIIPDMNDDKGNSGYYYYSYGKQDS